MIDLAKVFSDTYNLLRKKPIIILPLAVSSIISFLLLALLLNISGVKEPINELISAATQFDEKKLDYLTDVQNVEDANYTRELAGYLSNTQYNKEMAAYLPQAGFDMNKLLGIFNIRNTVYLAIFLLVSFIIGLYASILTYSMASIYIRSKKINEFNYANKKFFSYIGLSLVVILLILVPALIGGLIVGISSLLGEAVLILFLILFILLFLAYLVLLSILLAFCTPAMFLKNTGIVDSIRESFTVVKNNKLSTFVLILIIGLLGWVASAFISNPLNSFSSGFMLGTGWLPFMAFIITLPVIAIITASITAFLNVMVFYGYEEVKKNG